jgi:hypothetical protein
LGSRKKQLALCKYLVTIFLVMLFVVSTTQLVLANNVESLNEDYIESEFMGETAQILNEQSTSVPPAQTPQALIFENQSDEKSPPSQSKVIPIDENESKHVIQGNYTAIGNYSVKITFPKNGSILTYKNINVTWNATGEFDYFEVVLNNVTLGNTTNTYFPVTVPAGWHILTIYGYAGQIVVFDSVIFDPTIRTYQYKGHWNYSKIIIDGNYSVSSATCENNSIDWAYGGSWDYPQQIIQDYILHDNATIVKDGNYSLGIDHRWVYVTEKFEDDEVGLWNETQDGYPEDAFEETPFPSGRGGISGNQAAEIVSSPVSSPGTRAMLLNDTGVSHINVTQTKPLQTFSGSGVYNWTWRWQSGDFDGNVTFELGDLNWDLYASVAFDNSTSTLRLMFRNETGWFLLQTANADQWYHMSIGYGTFGGGGKQFKIWVDDSLLVDTDGPITNDYDGNAGRDNSQFYSNDSGTCKVYIDTIIWYGSDTYSTLAYPREVAFDLTGMYSGNNWDFDDLKYIGFWIRQSQNPSDADPELRIGTGETSHYRRTIDIISPDVWQYQIFEVGTGSSGWSATDSPDWNDINYISFYWTNDRSGFWTNIDQLSFIPEGYWQDCEDGSLTSLADDWSTSKNEDGAFGRESGGYEGSYRWSLATLAAQAGTGWANTTKTFDVANDDNVWLGFGARTSSNMDNHECYIEARVYNGSYWYARFWFNSTGAMTDPIGSNTSDTVYIDTDVEISWEYRTYNLTQIFYDAFGLVSFNTTGVNAPRINCYVEDNHSTWAASLYFDALFIYGMNDSRSFPDFSEAGSYKQDHWYDDQGFRLSSTSYYALLENNQDLPASSLDFTANSYYFLYKLKGSEVLEGYGDATSDTDQVGFTVENSTHQYLFLLCNATTTSNSSQVYYLEIGEQNFYEVNVTSLLEEVGVESDMDTLVELRIRIGGTDADDYLNVEQLRFYSGHTIGPNVTLVSPANGSTTTTATTIDLDVSDDELGLSVVLYNWDGAANTTLTAPFDFTPSGLTEGWKTLNVYANNSMNMWTTKIWKFNVQEAPSVTLVSSTNNTVTGTVDFTITDNGAIDMVLYNWDGTSNSTLDDPYIIDISSLSEINHTLYLYVNDTADNRNDTVWILDIDRTEPPVVLISPANASINTGDTTILLNITDVVTDFASIGNTSGIWQDCENNLNTTDGWSKSTNADITTDSTRVYEGTYSADLTSLSGNSTISKTFQITTIADFPDFELVVWVSGEQNPDNNGWMYIYIERLGTNQFSYTPDNVRYVFANLTTFQALNDSSDDYDGYTNDTDSFGPNYETYSCFRVAECNTSAFILRRDLSADVQSLWSHDFNHDGYHPYTDWKITIMASEGYTINIDAMIVGAGSGHLDTVLYNYDGASNITITYPYEITLSHDPYQDNDTWKFDYAWQDDYNGIGNITYGMYQDCENDLDTTDAWSKQGAGVSSAIDSTNYYEGTASSNLTFITNGNALYKRFHSDDDVNWYNLWVAFWVSGTQNSDGRSWFKLEVAIENDYTGVGGSDAFQAHYYLCNESYFATLENDTDFGFTDYRARYRVGESNSSGVFICRNVSDDILTAFGWTQYTETIRMDCRLYIQLAGGDIGLGGGDPSFNVDALLVSFETLGIDSRREWEQPLVTTTGSSAVFINQSGLVGITGSGETATVPLVVGAANDKYEYGLKTIYDGNATTNIASNLNIDGAGFSDWDRTLTQLENDTWKYYTNEAAYVGYDIDLSGINIEFPEATSSIIKTLDTWTSYDATTQLNLYANDTGGNERYNKYLFSFDTTPARIDLTSPANNSVINQGSLIIFNITDATTLTVLYNWNGGTNQTLAASSPYQTTMPYDQGTHTLNIYTTDALGFTSSKTYVFNGEPGGGGRPPGGGGGGGGAVEAERLFVVVSYILIINEDSALKVKIKVTEQDATPVRDCFVEITYDVSTIIVEEGLDKGVYEHTFAPNTFVPGEYLFTVNIKKSGFDDFRDSYPLRVISAEQRAIPLSAVFGYFGQFPAIIQQNLQFLLFVSVISVVLIAAYMKREELSELLGLERPSKPKQLRAPPGVRIPKVSAFRLEPAVAPKLIGKARTWSLFAVISVGLSFWMLHSIYTGVAVAGGLWFYSFIIAFPLIVIVVYDMWGLGEKGEEEPHLLGGDAASFVKAIMVGFVITLGSSMLIYQVITAYAQYSPIAMWAMPLQVTDDVQTIWTQILVATGENLGILVLITVLADLFGLEDKKIQMLISSGIFASFHFWAASVVAPQFSFLFLWFYFMAGGMSLWLVIYGGDNLGIPYLDKIPRGGFVASVIVHAGVNLMVVLGAIIVIV